MSPIGLHITEFALPGADVLQRALVVGRWEYCSATGSAQLCDGAATVTRPRSDALFVR